MAGLIGPLPTEPFCPPCSESAQLMMMPCHLPCNHTTVMAARVL
jgi:hypothetical protein